MMALGLTDVNEQTRICSRHFLHGDSSNIPVLDLGKCFASPKKVDTDRKRRALKRSTWSPSTSAVCGEAKRVAVTPSSQSSSISAVTLGSTTGDEGMSVSVLSDSSACGRSDGTESSTALAARVEFLEAESKYLPSTMHAKTIPQLFRVEHITKNDSLVQFYTYRLFLTYLGQAAYELKYWGDSERDDARMLHLVH